MPQHNILGEWQLRQTNNFTVTVTVPFINTDGSFPVTGKHSNGTVQGSGFGRLGGLTAGGDEIHFRIGWANGTEGAYQGVFDPTGFINGSTFDVQHPDVTAGWRSLRSFAVS
ncbi:hypothetical protein GCM10020358_28410 [Amorphoplanes nipponensis]|uniref:Uncharacterized protein n=1 Tax=Actinoplanes nipponensis TaxID=135950 RepID=A0A919JFM7_9ACTN|nr:hypothetical protein [Actinoplanes nipponensis]GIE48475.1 hypothetical protein Ani05nite_20090 [Actinoplanes nipponensis]